MESFQKECVFEEIDYLTDDRAIDAAYLAIRECTGVLPVKSQDLIDVYRSIAPYFNNFIIGSRDEPVIAVGSLQYHLDRTVELRHIAVNPSFRREGFGSMLLRGIEKVAEAEGNTLIKVSSTAVGVPFYESNGYEHNTNSSYLDFFKWLS